MSLRNYLKGIADALRDNGAYSDQEDGKINAQEFSSKIYEVVEHKYFAGTAEGYVRGQEVGYEDGHEEGYHQGEAEGYKQGGLDASPQETVSGEAIGITDISPIEHNMAVSVRGKNLIPFPSVGGNYGLTYSSGYEKATNGITFTVNDDGSVYTRGSATGDAFFNLCKMNLNTNLTIMSGGENGKSYQAANLSVSKWVTYQKANGLAYIHIPKGTVIDEVLYPQIEESTTLTPFAPYIEDISTVKLYKSGEGVEPTVYDVSADGTVEGVKSLYPNTTLYTDTSGAVIEATYYQDGKKVKENLTDMILSLGGVINE